MHANRNNKITAQNNGRSTDNDKHKKFADRPLFYLAGHISVQFLAKVINRIFNRMSVGLEISLLFSIFHKVLPITIRRCKELNFVNINILWVTNFCFIIYGRVVTTLNRYYLYIHLNFMMITSSESETRKSKQFVCLYRTREIHIYYSSV